MTLLGIGAAGAITAASYLSYRKNQMDRLYAEAMGYPPFLRSSDESTAAVRKLAGYPGQRVTKMLLNVAAGRGPAQGLWPQTQEEAIKQLGERDDPEIGFALARLLQPQEGLATRRAAAAALTHVACKDECVRLVLHYLERIWRGDLNHEDKWIDPSNKGDQRTDLEKQQAALYTDLYSSLRREKTQTLANLVLIYGLGSTDPSPFALDLAPRLGLGEACPYLMETEQQLKNLSPEFYRAPRDELESAINALNCKGSGP